MEEFKALKESMTTDGALLLKKLADINNNLEHEWNIKLTEREKERFEALKTEKQNLRDIVSTMKKETEEEKKSMTSLQESFTLTFKQMIENDAAARLKEKQNNKKQSELQEEERERENRLREMKWEETMQAEKFEREKTTSSIQSLKSSFDNEKNAFKMEMQGLKEQFESEYLKKKNADSNEMNNKLATQIKEIEEIKTNLKSERQNDMIEYIKLKEALIKDREAFIREMEERKKAELIIQQENFERREEEAKQRKITENKIREDTLEYAKIALAKEVASMQQFKIEINQSFEEWEVKFTSITKSNNLKIQSLTDAMRLLEEKAEADRNLNEAAITSKFKSLSNDFQDFQKAIELSTKKIQQESIQATSTALLEESSKIDVLRQEVKSTLSQIKESSDNFDIKMKQSLDLAVGDVVSLKDSIKADRGRLNQDIVDLKKKMEETVTTVEETVSEKIQKSLTIFIESDTMKKLQSTSSNMQKEFDEKMQIYSKSLSDINLLRESIEKEKESTKKMIEQKNQADLLAQQRRENWENENNTRKREAEAKMRDETSEFVRLCLDREVSSIKQLKMDIQADKEREDAKLKGIAEKNESKMKEIIEILDASIEAQAEKESSALAKYNTANLETQKLTKDIDNLRILLNEERIKSVITINQTIEEANKNTQERNSKNSFFSPQLNAIFFFIYHRFYLE